MDNPEFENAPDLNKVAYDIAVESIAKIYSDLRGKGLGRRDAAAIVAFILKADDIEGEMPSEQ